jgi:hypothetical protein
VSQRTLRQAREALEAAEREHRRTVADCDYRRQQIELEQFTERHDQVVKAQVRLSEAEAVRESVRVDDDLVVRIEAAHLELAKAEAASLSGAATVEMTALRDVDIEVDGHVISLHAGVTDERAVTESLDLLPDVVQLRVRPGAEARALTESLNAAGASLDALCEGGGVACGCRKRVRVRGGYCRSCFLGRVTERVRRSGCVCDGLAVVGVVQAAWRYSLMSPLQVGCRRVGWPG